MLKYYLTKKDFEDLECNVITYQEPVTVINETPMTAKMYKFKDLEQLKSSDLVKNIKAMKSYIFMFENPEAVKFMFSDFEFGFGKTDTLVDNMEEAEELIVRLFVCN